MQRTEMENSHNSKKLVQLLNEKWLCCCCCCCYSALLLNACLDVVVILKKRLFGAASACAAFAAECVVCMLLFFRSCFFLFNGCFVLLTSSFKPNRFTMMQKRFNWDLSQVFLRLNCITPTIFAINFFFLLFFTLQNLLWRAHWT